MFEDLIKERDKAHVEWKKVSKSVRPYWDKYMETEKAIEKKFIEEKLYIPINKLKNYLKEQDASSLTILYKNGNTEDLYHEYSIDVQDGKIISGCDDAGYWFEYDIKKEHPCSSLNN